MSPRDTATSSSRSSTKRLIRELEQLRKEDLIGSPEDVGIERLGPVNDEDLFQWEAVINGRGVGSGYDAGRWLLIIDIPTTYPLQPPKVRFATAIVHANVSLKSGEVCLDLLSTGWTPAYGIAQCVRAVRLLLAHPATDSPLNVDIAALLRDGDTVAARALVEYWCATEGGKYRGL